MASRTIAVFQSRSTYFDARTELVYIDDDQVLCYLCNDFIPVGCVALQRFRDGETRGYSCTYCYSRSRRMWAKKNDVEIKGPSRIERMLQEELACHEEALCRAWHLTKEMVYV